MFYYFAKYRRLVDFTNENLFRVYTPTDALYEENRNKFLNRTIYSG
jgi:hypothetical protein